jgi:hypothetical protein
VGWYGPDVFNVMDYGASPSASAATNTAAIQAAINAAGQRGEVSIPQGVYEIDDELTATMSSDGSMVSVKGAGFAVTNLKQVTTGKSVFNITETARSGCFEISYIRLSTGVSGLSDTAAVKVTNTSTSGQNNSHDNYISRDVAIVGLPGATGYFKYGFELTGIWYSHFHNVHYIGNNAGGGTGWALRSYWLAQTTVLLNRPYKILSVGSNSDWSSIGGPSSATVGATFAANSDAAIPSSGGTASLSDMYTVVAQLFDCSNNLASAFVHVYDHVEGLVIVGAQCNGCDYGIITDEKIVQLSMLGCYIDVGVGNVVATGGSSSVDQGAFHGNNFYLATNIEGNAAKAINGNFVRCQFVGNNFIGANKNEGGGRIGLNLTSSSSVTVVDNTFHQFTGKWVKCDSACSDITIRNNVRSDTAPATTPYELAGNSNSRPPIVVSQAAGACVRVVKNADQSIPTNSWTAVTFQSESYDDFGMWSSANSERLTVPYGVSRVRLTANIAFESNSSGYRYIAIERNNGERVASQLQVATLNSQINLCSSPINVSENDYFIVYAEQNTGGNLNVLVSSETSFGMEVIA